MTFVTFSTLAILSSGADTLARACARLTHRKNFSVIRDSAIAMVLGFLAIRNRRIAVHRACMLTAVGFSALFLCSYLVYHAQVGSRPYEGQGWLRAAYFAIRYFLAALRLGGVSGVRCFPRSQTEAGDNVGYRNPKERARASPLYCGDNNDARNRLRSDIFRRRATWPCGVFVQMPR